METTVVALYIHGPQSSRPEDTDPTPMIRLRDVDVVEGIGVRQDQRYFRPADSGRDRLRQVSLIDEGTIQRHEAMFGPIDRSFIKAQIILSGDVYLPDLLGSTLAFGEGAELEIALPRKPCFAMDLIKRGLRAAMQDGQQGALARVTSGGRIAIGQTVIVRPRVEVSSSR